MDIQKESAKNKLEMFSLEWWKQKGKESYNSFLIENKLSGASDFKLKEYYKIWLNEELKRIDQRLSDKYPNGKPKGNSILLKPYYKVELLEYHNYILNEVSSEEGQLKPKTEKENPHPEIFPDVFSFMLFERLHKIYKNSNNLLADYSFIYRKLWELDHILKYQKPEMFRDWLCREPYEIILGGKFKTLENCKTKNKEENFKLVFDLVGKI